MSGIDDRIPSAMQIRKEAALKVEKAAGHSPCHRLEGFALFRGARRQRFTRLVIATAIVEVVDKLNLEYPEVSPEQIKDLAEARTDLKQQE
jgi:hypothetical protein